MSYYVTDLNYLPVTGTMVHYLEDNSDHPRYEYGQAYFRRWGNPGLTTYFGTIPFNEFNECGLIFNEWNKIQGYARTYADQMDEIIATGGSIRGPKEPVPPPYPGGEWAKMPNA